MNVSAFAVLPYVVTSLVYFVIGSIWYMPLFGKIWQKQTGVTMTASPGMGAMIWPMIGQLVGSFLFVCGVYMVVMLGNFSTLKGGLIAGASVGAFFGLSINSGKLLFQGKPVLFLIDAGYNVVGALVAGVMLALWK